MTGVAVKVTGVPSQILPAGEAAIVTLAGIKGLTSMIIGVETAGFPVAQSAFEVTITFTV